MKRRNEDLLRQQDAIYELNRLLRQGAKNQKQQNLFKGL
jgi:hypothetical protein